MVWKKSENLSGACSKWPWQEKEEPQAVEVKSPEEQDVEEDVNLFFLHEIMFELESVMKEVFRKFLVFLSQI